MAEIRGSFSGSPGPGGGRNQLPRQTTLYRGSSGRIQHLPREPQNLQPGARNPQHAHSGNRTQRKAYKQCGTIPGTMTNYNTTMTLRARIDKALEYLLVLLMGSLVLDVVWQVRSEERRVGKECRVEGW